MDGAAGAYTMSQNHFNAVGIREAAKAARAAKRNMAILSPFMSGTYQNGFQSGYLKGLTDAYIELHGEEPPTSILVQWKEVAGRKASGG